jgi:predicted membrane protein
MIQKATLLLWALLLSTVCLAQYPNWGWGPAITISQNGTTLNCSTFDPFTNSTKTTTVSNVDVYQYNDGVLAYVTPGGTVGGVIYDVNQGSWESTTFSSNSGNTIQNNDGVIAWVSAAGTVGGAVYDPHQRAWESTTFSSNSGNAILNRDGVIAWVSAAGTVGGAVYDPAQQTWESTTFSSNSGNTILNADGVIAWVSAAGTVGGAVYDPAQRLWESTTFSSNSGNAIVNANGVIAFISAAGTVGGAVYDFDQQVWESTTFSSGSSNTNLTILDGTIFWTGSSGTQHQGYRFSSQSWQSNQNTELKCKMFVANATGNTPLISYFWCLTVGANSYSYNSGAGHTITRRWGFKQYDNPGTFAPELTIFNSNSNTSCNATVTVGGVAVEEPVQGQISISPNPLQQGDRLEIKASKPIRNVAVRNMLGVEILSMSGSSSRMSVDLGGMQLASGVYFVEVVVDGNAVVRRKILVE